jgi:hypothetical protein
MWEMSTEYGNPAAQSSLEMPNDRATLAPNRRCEHGRCCAAQFSEQVFPLKQQHCA